MSTTPTEPLAPRAIVIIGLLALAVAMGIGRFSFTPLMPLMLRDASLDVATGAEWAAANYIGYLAGALSATWFARRLKLGLGLGLLGVAVSTLGMALAHLAPAWVGGLLRGVSGVCSAWVMVCVNSWCLPLLARQHATAMSGWIYTGVGIGIAATGLLAWMGGHQSAVLLWIELGLLTAVGALTVRQALTLQPPAPDTTPAAKSAQSVASLPTVRHPLGLVVCYGAFGYGYIVPATFLPTMGRQLVDDPWVFGLTWPLFGLAAALSVALASRWLAGWPRRQVWAMAQALMAAGTCIPLLHQSVWALAASAVLVGGTFMVTTMAGLQWARESRPLNPTPLLARMTGAFAVGQIAGPLLIRLMSVVDISPTVALDWANGIATVLLIITAAWLWRGPPLK